MASSLMPQSTTAQPSSIMPPSARIASRLMEEEGIYYYFVHTDAGAERATSCCWDCC